MAQRQRGLGELIVLGSTLVGSIVGGLIVGLLVDHFAHTMPIFTLVGVALGLISAGSALYIQIRDYLK